MNKRIYSLAVLLLALFVSFSACKKETVDDDPPPTPLTPREQAIDDYKKMYIGSALSDPGFTGNTVGCLKGACSQESHTKVVLRINYFRKLVGLPANITHNASQNDKCQEAALYMAANNTLTHHPPASGLCYTQGAYDAASKGNLAISSGMPGNTAVHSVNSVTGYIEDPGANNKPVGHRAWLLQPELVKIGHGSVWMPNLNNRATNCLMWGDNINGPAATIPFVAYPPKGFMPGPLVFPRWSFSIKGATFNNAQVTMTGPSGNVNLTIVHRSTSASGMPDPRIVWEPQGVQNTGMEDIKYTVTVSNITGVNPNTYTYDVIIIPNTLLARYGIKIDQTTPVSNPNAYIEIH